MTDKMIEEMSRLALGLMIALFHRPLADFMLRQERVLVVIFRQRGVPYPATPTAETARNVYFGVGILLAMYELVRIWMLLHPAAPLATFFVH
jgi:hypothetical protein